jgi:3-deoxy-D-manno-octulosonic acid (KDO) 8-phosphate synthase
VIGLGVRIVRSQISDPIVYDVLNAVQRSSGDNPSPEAMRAHIRKDRARSGLYVGAAGVVLIAVAFIVP